MSPAEEAERDSGFVVSEGLRLGGLALGGLGLAVSSSVPVALGATAAWPVLDWLRRRPPRGSARLGRALRAALEHPHAEPGELSAFLEQGRFNESLRLEAAGWRAVLDLEAGRFDRSAAFDGELALPPNLPPLGRGRIAGLALALRTRLGLVRGDDGPESWSLVPAVVAADWGPDCRRDYDAILISLAVHEAASDATQTVLEANWRRLLASKLVVRWPTLAALAAAAAAERVPAARTTLEEWTGAAEFPRASMNALARVFPSLELRRAEGGYRSMAQAPSESVSLTMYRPPSSITQLSTMASASGQQRRLQMLSRVAAGPVGAILLAGATLPTALGVVLAGMWTARKSRLARVPALAQMPRGPTPTWLREFSQAPDAPRGSREAPLKAAQLELYMACVRAEQALALGETEEAWSWVAWWFADRDYRRAPSISLEPVASTLLRVACLANRSPEARSLAHVLRPTHRPRPSLLIGRGRRTIHGDAPRALGLARALVFARANAWSEAAQALRGVAGARAVQQSERDQVLYALMCQRVSGMSRGVDPSLCRISPRSVARVEPWLERVWPQLLSRSYGRPK